MIKLIVGLGNPGQQYEKTRHNAGFLFLERLVSYYGSSWTQESKFQAWLASCHISSQKVMLIKPNTFMNHSGQSVGKLVHYYKLQSDEVLVVHDELDFIPGMVKLKKTGGHGGHNGLRDIIAHLGSKDFYRLRIGIGRPSAGKAVADYVLSNPSKIEMRLIEESFTQTDSILKSLLLGDIASAMKNLHTIE